jgi:triosephosphate isomerase
MHKLVIANWKMNPQTLEEAKALAHASDASGIVIAPPFPFLGAVRAVLSQATLGSQDIATEDRGASTGEVSGPELASLGVQYVIVGHSERRRNQGETDAVVAQKLDAALRSGITPVLCVGESARERAAGETRAVLERELSIPFSCAQRYPKGTALVVAYEPVWAISTEPHAVPDTPLEAGNTIEFIRSIALRHGLTVRVIYGGSLTAANAEGFLKVPGIAGALVGSASLDPRAITSIVRIAKNYG